MPESLLSMEQFLSWLCTHEYDVVGCPGTCFHAPLAQWLTDRYGGVWGIDDYMYGLASRAYTLWSPLPRWARLFIAHLERQAFRPVTGDEALLALAEVELALPSLQRGISAS